MRVAGVKDSAAVGVTQNGEERVQVALIVEPGTDAADVVKAANAQLADHQRIRAAQIWPGAELPRTEGTRKLKRHEIRAWLQTGAPPAASTSRGSQRRIGHRALHRRPRARAGATLEEMGLSSLERIEMMVALEEALNTTIDETAFSNVKTVADLERLTAAPAHGRSGAGAGGVSVVESRAAVPRAPRDRAAGVPASADARLRVDQGRRAGAPARRERPGDFRVESSEPHGCAGDSRGAARTMAAPCRDRDGEGILQGAFFSRRVLARQACSREASNYYLSAAVFNTFPLPQREAGARQTLRYAGELISNGFSVLIFPEGKRTDHGEIAPFRPGVGMMAARLGVPVIPVRLEGIDRVLHHTWKMATPGPVRVIFGAADAANW